jgi:hypothetical protein
MHVQAFRRRAPQTLLRSESVEVVAGELPRGFELPDQVASVVGHEQGVEGWRGMEKEMEKDLRRNRSVAIFEFS